MRYAEPMRVFTNGTVTLTEAEAVDIYGPGEVAAAVQGASALLRVKEMDEDTLLRLMGLDDE